MSDAPQAEDWWQASDGKWYPPQQHADNRDPEATRSTGGLPPQAVGAEPAVSTLQVDGALEMPRWRPLVQWAMAIPVIIMGVFVQVLGIFALLIAWFAVLFTGRMPTLMHNLITLWIRFHFRLFSFIFGWTIVYPPLTFSPGGPDDGEYDTVTVTMPGLEGETSRVALIHWLMAIPHLIILAALGYAVLAVGAISWFAVLFTGRYPEGLRKFMIDVANWQLRVQAYVGMLNSDYPKFGF
jgi:hypothetical protein